MSIGHLWAIGYDDMGRAEQVRDEIVRLGKTRCLIVLDTAVVVRHPDGTTTLDGEPFRGATGFGDRTMTGFFARLALGAPPLTASAVRAMLQCVGAVPPTP